LISRFLVCWGVWGSKRGNTSETNTCYDDLSVFFQYIVVMTWDVSIPEGAVSCEVGKNPTTRESRAVTTVLATAAKADKEKSTRTFARQYVSELCSSIRDDTK